MKKLKISISYPSLESKKGAPTLTQNRQFQWFSDPTYIFPVIPAYAATLLEKNGYEVFWDDAIAEELSFDEWKQRLIREKPDIVAIETKTPVVKRHWRIITKLKEKSLEIGNWKLEIVLMGDHVTALPEESLENSKVDYVLTGGDYDFLLLNLANHLSRGEKLEGGFWYRNENGNIVNSGKLNLSSHSLNALPLIDRELTKWKLYAYKNGNFKYTPGAYIMSGRDCWWGKCSFCSWTTLFPQGCYRVMDPEKALDEVGDLIELGAREIMEDSGTLPVGEWLEEFCQGMIEKGYHKKVTIDCNMRLNAIKNIKIWELMKRAGFRMILFGLESASQRTLDRINKNLQVSEIKPALEMCKSSGLEPHLTVMLGYPWETKKDVETTLSLVKKLFKKGLIDTLQATIAIPYPGTPLYKYCRENNLLLTEDYDRYDQGEAVMKSGLNSNEARALVSDVFKTALTPKFLAKKITSIRGWADARYLTRAARKVVVKLINKN